MKRMQVKYIPPTNEERAARIEPVLAAYRRAANGNAAPDEADLCDMLADCMHWALTKKMDFEKELNRARMNFDAEQNGEE